MIKAPRPKRPRFGWVNHDQQNGRRGLELVQSGTLSIRRDQDEVLSLIHAGCNMSRASIVRDAIDMLSASSSLALLTGERVSMREIYRYQYASFEIPDFDNLRVLKVSGLGVWVVAMDGEREVVSFLTTQHQLCKSLGVKPDVATDDALHHLKILIPIIANKLIKKEISPVEMDRELHLVASLLETLTEKQQDELRSMLSAQQLSAFSDFISAYHDRGRELARDVSGEIENGKNEVIDLRKATFEEVIVSLEKQSGGCE